MGVPHFEEAISLDLHLIEINLFLAAQQVTMSVSPFTYFRNVRSSFTSSIYSVLYSSDQTGTKQGEIDKPESKSKSKSIF